MHIIIIGCGRVGSQAAAAFSRQGHSVVVIDRNPASFRRLPSAFVGTKIPGIAYDKETMEKAGIQQADALVAVTSGDNSNIVAARIAKEVYRVPIVLSRIYDPQRAEIYRRFGVTTFAPTVWGANRVVELVTSVELGQDISLGNGEVEMVRASAPPHLIGKPPGALNVPGEIAVAAIIRMGKAIIPVSGTRFEDGDELHVLVHRTAIEKLEKMMGLK